MTYPPAIARQLDRCDRCGRKVHKKDLIRSQIEFSPPLGENLFSYSSYDGTYWYLVDGTYQNDISIGPYADKARSKISLSNTLTEINGSATFYAGTGTGQLNVMTSESLDVSSYDSIVFSVICGPYHANESRDEMTLYFGFSDGSDSYVSEVYTVTEMRKLWFYTTPQILDSKDVDSSAVYPYVLVNVVDYGNNQLFLEDFQLTSNVTVPGEFIRTSGSAITRTTPTRSMVIEKLCEECRKIKILRRSTQRGNIPEGTEVEPPTILQEI